MTLAPGSRVGPYEIVSVLGAGGMGEVYRARDTRLGREVALKVIAFEGPPDADRLRRFEQEARAVAALSHPNVLVIHDSGMHDGAPYLVTELLEGETVAALIARGPVPVRRALELAAQIARGLAAAHEKGILHRDVKPANLFVSKAGQVKLLDFGLAKVSANAEPATGTLTDGTGAGVVLGSPGYMAPEQVRGRVADARSDLFAFGAVLYELVSGSRAFDGATPVERGYAILNSEPLELSPEVPRALDRIIRRCLEKDPENRFQSGRDLAFSLDGLGSAFSTSAPQLARPRRSFGVIAALAALCAAALLGAWLRPAPQATYTLPRYTRVTYQQRPAGATLGQTARFAPDGRTVVFTAVTERGLSQLYSAVPGTPVAQPISAPNTVLYDISPDGELAVGVPAPASAPFIARRTLARMPATGGAPREVLEQVAGAAWGASNSLAAILTQGGKSRLEYPIGKVLYESGGSLSFPRISRRTGAAAFIEFEQKDYLKGAVVVIDPAGTKRVLTRPYADVRGLAWSSDGSELWMTASAMDELGPDSPGSAKQRGEGTELRAVSLEGVERILLRSPVNMGLRDVAPDGRVLIVVASWRHRAIARVHGAERDVDISPYRGLSEVVDLSRDGTQVLLETTAAERTNPYLVTVTGGAVPLGEGTPLALSPDGRWVVVSPVDKPGCLRLLPTRAGQPRDLECGPWNEVFRGFWVPGTTRILIVARVAGRPTRIFAQDVDGGAPQVISEEGVVTAAPPSPDGLTIATYDLTGRAARMRLADGSSEPLTGLALYELPIQWTADGGGLFVRRFWRHDGVEPANASLSSAPPVEIFRYDVATGTSAPWRTITGPDWEVSGHIDNVMITPDGAAWAYGEFQSDPELYVVEGLR